MRRGKLISGVIWQGMLKKGVKQGLGVYGAHLHNKLHIKGVSTVFVRISIL